MDYELKDVKISREGASYIVSSAKFGCSGQDVDLEEAIAQFAMALHETLTPTDINC